MLSQQIRNSLIKANFKTLKASASTLFSKKSMQFCLNQIDHLP